MNPNQIDIAVLSTEELRKLGLQEYNRREMAKAAITETENNINLINTELNKREQDAATPSVPATPTGAVNETVKAIAAKKGKK